MFANENYKKWIYRDADIGQGAVIISQAHRGSERKSHRRNGPGQQQRSGAAPKQRSRNHAQEGWRGKADCLKAEIVKRRGLGASSFILCFRSSRLEET